MLIKAVDNDTGGWFVIDSTRGEGKYFYLNNDDSGQFSASIVQFTDTGFNVLNAGVALNGLGQQYVYMAIAEPPSSYEAKSFNRF